MPVENREVNSLIRVLQSVSNMNRAGTETMLMNYYRHIDRDRVQFDFLCNKNKPGAYDAEIEELGGRIFRTPGFNPFHYNRYLKYMHNLFQEHPEYRIIHSHNSALGVYPLYAAKREGIEHRIAHVHSAAFTADYKLPIKMFCRPLLPHCANHRWGCGVKAVTFYYGKKRVANHETRVIHNAIEIDRFLYNENVREKMRNQNNLQGKFVIGHVGRFASQKNHSFLVDIFSEIVKRDKSAALVLLGDGELLEKMKEKVRGLGLQDAVLFPGNVNNVNEWYQAMDVFVLPSIWEGLPVSGIEAQTADLPCFFSEDVTREAAILPTASFISRKQGPDVWAERILSCKNRSGRTSQKSVIQDAGYDINVEAVKLMQLYEDMASGKQVI